MARAHRMLMHICPANVIRTSKAVKGLHLSSTTLPHPCAACARAKIRKARHGAGVDRDAVRPCVKREEGAPSEAGAGALKRPELIGTHWHSDIKGPLVIHGVDLPSCMRSGQLLSAFVALTATSVTVEFSEMQRVAFHVRRDAGNIPELFQ